MSTRPDSTVAIRADTRTDPPAWALLQRQLIQAIDAAAPIFMDKYTHPDGQLIWRSEPPDEAWVEGDDLYESFFNWPLFYALGGSQYCGDMGGRQWNAITRQLEALDQVTNEFVNGVDWFHHGENYINLYYLGFAAPGLADMEIRARRFAGWYIGEDAQVPNYDRQHRVIPGPFTGSLGPQVNFPVGGMRYHLGTGSATLGPDHQLLESWFDDEELTRLVRRDYDHVVMREDIPLNLSATALVAHAYLYTGEDKYRDWIVEYTDAWMVRMEQNGGIIPDNVGRSGKVGEYRQGQWWGGFYGWSSRFSPDFINIPVTVAAECAHLVTGDDRYLQFLRSHLDGLLDRSVEEDGRLLVPGRHMGDGWTGLAQIGANEPIHLWANSMEERDRLLLDRLRQGCQADWRRVESLTPRLGDDRAWTRYLAGEIPDYPERILQANYREVCRRLEMVMQDDSDLTLVDEHHWQDRQPVLTEALVHLTTGGPQAVYWGGLSQGRVRYFDVEKRRPGLPEEVAALVTGLAADRVDLTLVNLSPSQSRQLLICAGSFGQHRFNSVSVDGGERSIGVEGTYLQVDMRPASQIDLRLSMERNCSKPSYAFPF